MPSVIHTYFNIFKMLICYSDPESHPFISEKEKDHLKKELGQLERDKNLPPTPWRAILTSVPMLALVCAQVGPMHSDIRSTFNYKVMHLKDWTRLGFLCDGDRFTEIHVRCVTVFNLRKWTIFVASLSFDVDCFHFHRLS